MFNNRKKCNYSGCNNPVWSKGLCKNHTARSSIGVRKKSFDLVNKSVEKNLMHVFFLDIWKERKHRSEVSRTPLGSEARSTFFHHILPKSKYPQAAFDPENIILLTFDEHMRVESDMYKYKEVNRRRDILKKKYDLHF